MSMDPVKRMSRSHEHLRTGRSATGLGPRIQRRENAVAGALLALTLSGCGAGTANLLPIPTQPSTTLPSGPTLGYIFSPTDGTLRAMLGVRGSAQLSASIVPAGVYVAGETSTASSAGLLEDEAGSLFAFNLPLSQPIHVADGLAAGSKISFASSGQTAIAYAVGASSVTLITGLPTRPQAQTIAVSGANKLVSAAVSDSGTIAMVAQGSPMPVGTLSAKGSFSPFTTVSATGGLSFIPASDDLLIADKGANSATLVRNASTSPFRQMLSAAGMNQSVAIAGSRDKKWAVIANSGDSSLLRVDLTAGAAATRLVCDCKPSQLNMLAGNSMFRVNALGTGPVWTVDLNGAKPQLLFVPAIGKGTP